MPAISIIVPVYNAEKYIHKCIESILSQTFTDFELLLIDDGSLDNSGKICDEYANKDFRIKAFHKENGGVSSARQFGLDHACGEYLIHADPDDWVEPDMLENLYQCAKREDADMVICDFFVNIGSKEFYVAQKPKSLDSETVLCDLFRKLHGSSSNKLIRRSCFIDYSISYPSDLSFCEDLFVNTSLLLHNIKVFYLDKAFFHYVKGINENSIVKSYDRNTLEYDEHLFNRFSELTKGSICHNLCINNMAYIVLWRAFNGKIFSNKEYCQIGRKYCKKMLFSYNPLINKIAILFSCLGFYRIICLILKYK